MFQTQKGFLDTLVERRHPSWWRLFFKAPCKTLARAIVKYHRVEAFEPSTSPVRVICVSDTHNSQPNIPDGDLFIHAGDLSQSGTLQELQQSLDWINSLPHQHKVVIAGNHDMLLDQAMNTIQHDTKLKLDWGSITYLQDRSTVLRFRGGQVLKVHGSPWTRKHGSWAFQYPAGSDRWTGTIPLDTDILVTHCPPRFHLDIDGFGDEFLLQELWRVKPRLHVFGHVHEGYGKSVLAFDSVERLYESLCGLRGGVWQTGLLMYEILVNYFRGAASKGTTLVNASAVGGLKDDTKRAPICVTL